MHITAYIPGYAIEIANIFSQSVHAIDGSIYAPAQKSAWAPLPPNYFMWISWCEKETPLPAFEGDALVGFMSLNISGYIERAFVHPKTQRRGVGTALLHRTEAISRTLSFPRLQTDVPLTARPFFEKCGFRVLHENSRLFGDSFLSNYTMEKQLS